MTGSAGGLLLMQGIRKEYPGVVALDGVDLDVRAGEIHCLLGENGAGKSTLMNILAGAVGADAGTITLAGLPVSFRSPADALALGVGMIYQDPMLVPELSVAENILLGHEPGGVLIDRPAMRRRTSEILSSLGASTAPGEPAGRLGPAHRQIVAIARALSRDLRLLILDEPSVALTEHELQNLYAVLRRLRDAGTGVIYITHRLEEIFAIGDRITILRDGRRIDCVSAASSTTAALIGMMAGSSGAPAVRHEELRRRETSQGTPEGREPAEAELLRAERLSGGVIDGVSFDLHRGEVLGVAGLAGSGRSTLGRLIFGATEKTGGAMTLEGRQHSPRSPKEGIEAGVGYLPGDRNHEGLIFGMSIRENMMLAGGPPGRLIDRAAEEEICRGYMKSLEIGAPSSDTPVEFLSGGNKQKVILARWLLTSSRILIFDEPTAGIDVGVKFEFHRTIGRLASEGKGIIVLSSDLPELLAVCDRILVLAAGRPAGILEAAAASQERIISLAMGG